MAKSTSVWGIDVGQAALKALRCRMDGDQVVAEAFDYIEYPKILTQPEAEPEAMVFEALQTFIGRNNLKKTKIALSVPGQNGLAKFFKPPPVELKKVGDIVKYEARQQIPFDLQDVVWDYQLMAGGQIENGFALESEVGLFAMKRDAVTRALKPLKTCDIEVDVLQLAPLSIYNAITYDRVLLHGDEDHYDSDHPPKSVVILAMGTDATDLIVTNGYRVWQRSMPLGGNHFTRQLTKDLKLTFAKAEHLKRNAMEADDPKLVFQAMRPVFNDLVTEIQRSIGFFKTLNKKAEIGSLLLLGNSVKLPGLTQYLNKNLSMDVAVIDKFDRLSGEEVLSAPAFHDHITSFASVYGLCLQGLNTTAVYTNLIPQELFTERMVRAKKPWAVAAAATLLLGMTGSLIPAGNRFTGVHPDKWKQAVAAADQTKSVSDSQQAEDKKQLGQVELLTKIGSEVGGSRDRRLLWLEMLSAINQALDRAPDEEFQDPKKVPFNERTTIYVTKLESKYFEDLSTYKTEAVEAQYESNRLSRLQLLGLLKDEPAGDAASADASATTTTTDSSSTSTSTSTTSTETSTSNGGWVIELDAYHFHNGKPEYRNSGDEQDGFVLKTLINKLEEGKVKLPVENEEGKLVDVEFTFKELGISHPMMVTKGTYNPKFMIDNPEYKPPRGSLTGGGEGGPGGMGGGMGGPGGGRGGGGMGGMGGGLGGGPGGMGGGLGGPGGLGGGGLGGGAGLAGSETKEDPDNPRRFEAPKHSFKIQFIWQEKTLSIRLAEKKAKEAAEEEARKAKEAEEAKPADESGGNVASL